MNRILQHLVEGEDSNAMNGANWDHDRRQAQAAPQSHNQDDVALADSGPQGYDTVDLFADDSKASQASGDTGPPPAASFFQMQRSSAAADDPFQDDFTTHNAPVDASQEFSQPQGETIAFQSSEPTEGGDVGSLFASSSSSFQADPFAQSNSATSTDPFASRQSYSSQHDSAAGPFDSMPSDAFASSSTSHRSDYTSSSPFDVLAKESVENYGNESSVRFGAPPGAATDEVNETAEDLSHMQVGDQAQTTGDAFASYGSDQAPPFEQQEWNHHQPPAADQASPFEQQEWNHQQLPAADHESYSYDNGADTSTNYQEQYANQWASSTEQQGPFAVSPADNPFQQSASSSLNDPFQQSTSSDPNEAFQQSASSGPTDPFASSASSHRAEEKAASPFAEPAGAPMADPFSSRPTNQYNYEQNSNGGSFGQSPGAPSSHFASHAYAHPSNGHAYDNHYDRRQDAEQKMSPRELHHSEAYRSHAYPFSRSASYHSNDGARRASAGSNHSSDADRFEPNPSYHAPFRGSYYSDRIHTPRGEHGGSPAKPPTHHRNSSYDRAGDGHPSTPRSHDANSMPITTNDAPHPQYGWRSSLGRFPKPPGSTTSSVGRSRRGSIASTSVESSIRVSEMYKQMAERLEGEKNDLLKLLSDQSDQVQRLQQYIEKLEGDITNSKAQ